MAPTPSSEPTSAITTNTTTDLTTALVDQIDWHWQHQLRPRLEGLTDEEYLWEPVAGSWNVRQRGTGTPGLAQGDGPFSIDFAHPAPEPTPVTTIAWRLAHIIVGVLAARVHGHFGGEPADYETWPYPGTADGALAQLDAQYAAWLNGIRSWDTDALWLPCGPAEGPFGDEPRIVIVLHISRELIHHGAEIALLRDLYAHRAL